MRAMLGDMSEGRRAGTSRVERLDAMALRLFAITTVAGILIATLISTFASDSIATTDPAHPVVRLARILRDPGQLFDTAPGLWGRDLDAEQCLDDVALRRSPTLGQLCSLAGHPTP